MGILIKSFGGEGYSVVVESGSWKIAIMNYAERFDRLRPMNLKNISTRTNALFYYRAKPNC